MRRNGHLGASGKNSDITVWFLDSDFLISSEISAMRTFSFDFFIGKAKKSAIFLLPVYLTYWPRKCVTWWAIHSDDFYTVWSWYKYSLLSNSIVAADTLHENNWPFDLEQWSYVAGHMVNPSTKVKYPTPIRYWHMSCDFCHRPPLTMCLQPLHMRSITIWYDTIWYDILTCAKKLTKKASLV